MITIRLEEKYAQEIFDSGEDAYRQYPDIFTESQQALLAALRVALAAGPEKTIAERLGHEPDCFMCNHPELP